MFFFLLICLIEFKYTLQKMRTCYYINQFGLLVEHIFLFIQKKETILCKGGLSTVLLFNCEILNEAGLALPESVTW